MPHRVSCPEFVGRAEELDLLGRDPRHGRRGTAATVLVGGDAGIGKTRLVDEFARAADVRRAGGDRRVRPDRGRRPALRAGRRHPPRPRAPVGRRSPSAVSSLPSRPGLVSSRAAARPRPSAYSAVRRVADELAKTRRFESILRLRHRPGRAHPDRAGRRGPALGRLRQRRAARLPHPQPADASVSCCRHLPQRRARPRPPAAAVAERAEPARARHAGAPGRPRPQRDGDDDRRHPRPPTRLDAGRRRLVTLAGQPLLRRGAHRRPPQPVAVARIPGRRHAPRRGPVRRGAQQLLRVVGRGGRRGRPRAAGSGRPARRRRPRSRLAETIDHQILVVDPSQAGYRFRHELLREACTGRCCPGERRRLHRCVADALGRRRAASSRAGAIAPAELAAHWWAAGEWAEALEASLEAADAAGAVWAFPEAHAHLERALVGPRSPARRRVPVADRLRLLETAADVAYLGLASASAPSTWPARRSTGAERPTDRREHWLATTCCWAATPGPSGTRTPPSRRTGGRARSCPPIRPRSSWPGSWPKRPAASCSCRASSRPSALPRGPRRGRRPSGARAEEGHILCTLGCCPRPSATTTKASSWCARRLAIAEELADPDDLEPGLHEPEPPARRVGPTRGSARPSCSTARPPARSSGESG